MGIIGVVVVGGGRHPVSVFFQLCMFVNHLSSYYSLFSSSLSRRFVHSRHCLGSFSCSHCCAFVSRSVSFSTKVSMGDDDDVHGHGGGGGGSSLEGSRDVEYDRQRILWAISTCHIARTYKVQG